MTNGIWQNFLPTLKLQWMYHLVITSVVKYLYKTHSKSVKYYTITYNMGRFNPQNSFNSLFRNGCNVTKAWNVPKLRDDIKESITADYWLTYAWVHAPCPVSWRMRPVWSPRWAWVPRHRSSPTPASWRSLVVEPPPGCRLYSPTPPSHPSPPRTCTWRGRSTETRWTCHPRTGPPCRRAGGPCRWSGARSRTGCSLGSIPAPPSGWFSWSASVC